MLAELLRIKTLRADRAEQHMRYCRNEAARALRERQQAEHQRDEFQGFRQREENARYGALLGHRVRLRDIEGVREYLALLREQWVDYQQTVEERTKAHDAATEEARQAERLFVAADRAREKMLELSSSFDDEVARLLEHKEEQELEELTEARREQEEWDGLAPD